MNSLNHELSDYEELSDFSESDSDLVEYESVRKIPHIRLENFKGNNVNVCYANSALQSLLACGKKLFDQVKY